jgi:hypothetical protein
MDRTLTLEVQKLIDACETVIKSSYDNGGLSQADCDSVLFYARGLIQEIKPQCTENHSSDTVKKQVA